MLGFWGSHDFEEIHFCFIIYYFCFIGNFLEYIYIFVCIWRNYWPRNGVDANAILFFFIFLGILYQNFIFKAFLTNKFSLYILLGSYFSRADISFDKTHFIYN